MLEMFERCFQDNDKETSSELLQEFVTKPSLLESLTRLSPLPKGSRRGFFRAPFGVDQHPSASPLMNESGPNGETVGLFQRTFWFGLLAGWLELGLVRTQRVVNPHLPMDALRINRHFAWMIPVSDVLIFVVVGLLIAILGRFQRGLAHWLAWRLPVGLLVLTLLLSIEGMYASASLILACGLASKTGPWISRRADRFGRLVRLSVPVMVVGLIVLTGVNYQWVVSAEQRALANSPAAASGAPNVLLIVLDVVRAANSSLYGHPNPTTPELDRRAQLGLIFAEARSTAPWTLPSHASMLTGRWPHELSVGPDLPLDGTFPTLAEVLGKQGYTTAGFIGNTCYCNSLFGLGRGFARYEDYYETQTVSFFETLRSSGLGKRILQGLGYPIRIVDGETSTRKTAEMINRDVLNWLAQRPSNRPYFAFINYFDVHTPYVLHGDPQSRFGMASLPIAEQFVIDKRFLDLAAGKPAPAGLSANGIVKDAFDMYRDSYDSCLAYLDRQVGLLLDEIEGRGLLENTLVIVTSDHGEQLGEHGLLGHGLSLYRQEVHVPLVVIPPRRSRLARIVNEPVSLREIPATVAEWAGLGVRHPFPGRSLMRFLAGSAEPFSQESPVLSEVQQMEVNAPVEYIPSSLGPVSSLVTSDRVYIRSTQTREELYDRVNDPEESHDLASDPQSQPVIEQYRDELRRIQQGATYPAQ